MGQLVAALKVDKVAKRLLYSKIDCSILTSLVSGICLGLIPVALMAGYFVAAIVVGLLSLVLFFTARFNGLNFLFLNEKGEEDDLWD